MIRNTYTEFIEDKLNALIGNERFMNEPFEFYIHENEGEFWAHTKRTQRTLGKKVINAVLLDEKQTPIALKDLDAWEMRKTLEIAVPVDMTETDSSNGAYTNGIGYAMGVLNELSRSLVGETGTIAIDNVNYTYVLNCSTPNVGSIGDYGKAGRVIPVTIDLVWRIYNGILSNNVHIEIQDANGNYERAVLVDGSLVRTRTGDTSAYNGEQEMKTSILQQGLAIKIAVPYRATGIGKMFMADLLTGDVEKTYRVKYWDNVVATSDAPIAWTMVATEINVPLQPASFMGITVTLQIAKE